MSENEAGKMGGGCDLKIQSPCVRNCCLDETDTCLGCYRTLSEILNWSSAKQAEKEVVLLNCELRKGERICQLPAAKASGLVR